jgi:large subunit ribosomal protein L25
MRKEYRGRPAAKLRSESESLPSTAAMATGTSVLSVATREPSGSRGARRLRREGNVPGIVYGGGSDPVTFQVDARDLRLALQHAGAVLDLSIDGEQSSPVVVKELIRHPVTGYATHIDLLRVRLDVAIQATVALELTGAEDAPGVKEGGVLEHVTREVLVEALPNDIPDRVEFDVSTMNIGDTVIFSQLTAPANVTLIGEDETTIATLTPPRLQIEEEPEIEEETELVGEEGEEAPEGEAEAPAEGEAPAEEGSGGE